MPKPENTFIAAVHRHLPPPTELHREKMSNPYRGGTADVWYSGRVSDLWIEYKYITSAPKRAPLDPMELLSALQEQWLRGRFLEGRKVGVIIGSPKGGIVLTARAWESPVRVDQFQQMLQSRSDLARWIVTQTEGRPNAALVSREGRKGLSTDTSHRLDRSSSRHAPARRVRSRATPQIIM